MRQARQERRQEQAPSGGEPRAENASPAQLLAGQTLSPEAVLELQRQAGNVSVRRALLQRQDGGVAAPAPVVTPIPAPAPTATPGPGARPELSAQRFIGGFERFDCEYVPGGPVPQVGDFNVTLKVHITFNNFTRAMMRQPDFRGHRFTRAQMRDFRWTDPEKTAFQSGFVSSVQSAWSGKHTMHLDDPSVAEYRTRVNINVTVVGDPNAANMRMTAQKVPRGAPRFRSFVAGQEATLDIRDVSEPETRSDSGKEFVRQIGPFALGSADLTPDLVTQLGEIEGKLRPLQSQAQTDTLLGNDWAVDLTGRASSPGARGQNERLGRRRANAVWNQLRTDLARPSAPPRVRSVGEEHATPDPRFQRVDVEVWNVPRQFATPSPTVTQNTAAHEAGHMFGLGDEYVEETPPHDVEAKFMGDRPSHFGDVEALMGTDAANELLIQDSGSIMSGGSDVHRGHYVYFLEALNRLTSKQWTVE